MIVVAVIVVQYAAIIVVVTLVQNPFQTALLTLTDVELLHQIGRTIIVSIVDPYPSVEGYVN